MRLLHRIQGLDASRRHLDVVQCYIPVLLINNKNDNNDAIVVGHIHSNLVETIRNKLDTMDMEEGDNNKNINVYRNSFLFPSPLLLPATTTSATAAVSSSSSSSSSSLTRRDRFFGIVVNNDQASKALTTSKSMMTQNNELVDARNLVLETFTDLLLECNIISKRHTDMYPITDIGAKKISEEEGDEEKETILATVNRMAAPFLGITSVGVHLLCYVRGDGDGDDDDDDDDGDDGDKTSKNNNNDNNNNVSLWLAQRAANKSHYPLYWDPTVAGGQPADIGLFQNVIKEAGEEAGIDPELVTKNAISTGGLSQMTCKPNGTCMKQSLYYIWDMQVDRKTFIPHPTDGEVVQFELCTAKQLEYEVRYGDRLRPAMILVITDFLIRHGIITPDNESDYAKITAAIHRERLVLEYTPLLKTK
jgi:isopentenyldiphosphate isomerase